MRVAIMWCVVNGVVGGILLCAVGANMGLGKVTPQNYNGALPRYEVIAEEGECKIVRHICEGGNVTIKNSCD